MLMLCILVTGGGGQYHETENDMVLILRIIILWYITTFYAHTSKSLYNLTSTYNYFLAKLNMCPAKSNLARKILYELAINGNFVEFAKENECPDNFQSLSEALQSHLNVFLKIFQVARLALVQSSK